MTVHNSKSDMDINKEGVRDQKRKTQVHQSGPQPCKEIKSASDYELKNRGSTPGAFGKANTFSLDENQTEALNMTSSFQKRNKTETAISAFREISAMEFMKNAVEQLQEKVQASISPFVLRNGNKNGSRKEDNGV